MVGPPPFHCTHGVGRACNCVSVAGTDPVPSTRKRNPAPLGAPGLARMVSPLCDYMYSRWFAC